MTVKVYGTYYSPASSRALVTLLEKEVNFELVKTSIMEGEHKKPEFLALNPFGLVPLLQDGNVQVYESRAIMRYIADKYEAHGTAKLHGSTHAERALVEQWLEVESGTFSPMTLMLVTQLLYNPGVYSKAPDQMVVEEYTDKLATVLDIYDSHLSKHKYLAGEFISIADLGHLPFGYLYFNVLEKQELLRSRKRVAAWWTDVSTRPAWKQIIAIVTPDYQSWAQAAKNFKPSGSK